MKTDKENKTIHPHVSDSSKYTILEHKLSRNLQNNVISVPVIK